MAVVPPSCIQLFSIQLGALCCLISDAFVYFVYFKMSGNKKKICRLCLTVVTHEFEIIDELRREMLGVVLLTVNIEVSQYPIICQQCVKTIKKILDFKYVCVNTELIRSFTDSREKPNFEIRDMYEDNGDVKREISEEFIVCRFCMNSLEMNQSVSLNSLMDGALFNKLLLNYMPEMDFNPVKNVKVCTKCVDNLECYFKFVDTFWETEKNINAYFQEKGTYNSGLVKLSNVLSFTSKGMLGYSNKYPQICANRQESSAIVFGDADSVCSELYVGQTKLEELDIKDDGTNIILNTHLNLEEIKLDQHGNKYLGSEMEINRPKSKATDGAEINMYASSYVYHRIMELATDELNKKKKFSKKQMNKNSAEYLKRREKANERKRRFLDKMTPEQKEMKREKDREYYQKKKTENKTKIIADMSEREKRQQRKLWTRNSKKYREKKKTISSKRSF